MKILENNIAIIETDSHIGSWVQETGRLDHDQSLLPILTAYLKPNDWVVDGGAFIGDHTIAYQRAVQNGVVFAFEPNVEAYECLKYNCKQSVCINAGLGQNPGLMGIIKSPNKGASFLLGSGGVMIMPLDSLQLPKLNFIKLDLEGMELEAILGSKETIQRHKPVICVEINRGALGRNKVTPDMLVDTIIGFGYKTKKVYPSDNLNADQLDLLFLPR